MTTTLGFAMFSFEGDEMVADIANYFRELKLKGSLISTDAVIIDLENLREDDRKKFGEATDTAVLEAVLGYIDYGVRTATFKDGDVREFPPTLTPDDYDYNDLDFALKD